MDNKGLIMNVEKGTANLMTQDGNLIGIKSKGIPPRVGQVSSGKLHKNHRYIKRFILVLIIFICAASAIIYHFNYASYSTVVIEARLCIQIDVNKRDQVIKVLAVNSSGQKVLKSVDLIGQPLDNALITIIDEAKTQKIIGENFIESNSKIILFVGDNTKGNINIDNFEQYAANNDFRFVVNNNGKLITNPKKKIINDGNNP